MSAATALARAFVRTRPERAAIVLQRLPAGQAAAVVPLMPPDDIAAALRTAIPSFAAETLSAVEPGIAARILTAMPTDDAARIARVVAGEAREAILARITEERRLALVRSLRYPDGTAGAVMDPSVLRLPESLLVADAQRQLRRNARDLLYYVYIVDEDQRLVGVLDIPELMLARPRDPLHAAMHRSVDRLPAWAPLAMVREHPGWLRYHALPVVEEDERLAGAIRYQTLRQLEREAAGGTVDDSRTTADALGELFRIGTTGLVAGVARAPAESPEAASPDLAAGGDRA